jgi:hypothetical protein
VFKTLSPDLIRRRLTSLFPAELIEDIARERDVVQRDRKINITMLVWTLIMGFAVDGEARSIAGFQRAYSAATNQTVARSSFYDRFTPALETLFGLSSLPCLTRRQQVRESRSVLASVSHSVSPWGRR